VTIASKQPTTGHAPDVMFETTVAVVRVDRSWTDTTEMPVSPPISRAAELPSTSQKPRP
jgi:hypothetical protein